MNTQAIVDLAQSHGATSYRNRADTQNPAYGFTEAGLVAFVQDLLAGKCLQQIAEPASDLQQLIAEINTHMRAEWDARRLPAVCWPTDLARRVRDAAAGAAPVQADARDALTPAARDVLAERQRQISAEGWAPQRDDQYSDCELAAAAATYVLCTEPAQLKLHGLTVWPWRDYWWKPGKYRRNLEKAGALILAEMERLDRAAIAAQAANGSAS